MGQPAYKQDPQPRAPVAQQQTPATVAPMREPDPEPEPESSSQVVLPKFQPTPQLDLRRHTFYATDDQIDQIKFWALIDKRKQSELMREALDEWLQKRAEKGYTTR